MATINGTDFATLFVAGGQVVLIANCCRAIQGHRTDFMR
jgi:hypothetical protein